MTAAMASAVASSVVLEIAAWGVPEPGDLSR